MKRLIKKDLLFTQLMQIYSLVIVGVIVLISLSFSLFIGISYYRDIENHANQSIDVYKNTIAQKKEIVSNVLYELTSNPDEFISLRKYLIEDPSDYFYFTWDFYEETGRDIYVPNKLTTIMNSYLEIESLDIYLDDLDYFLHVDRSNKLGIRQATDSSTNQPFSFVRAINEQGTSNTIGLVNISFSKDLFVKEGYHQFPKSQDSVVVTSTGEVLFSEGDNLNRKEKNRIAQTMGAGKEIPADIQRDYFIFKSEKFEGDQIIILSHRWQYITSVTKKVLLIIAFASFVTFVLLYFLRKTFSNYSKQVAKIVETTKQISLGNFDYEINEDEVQQELKDISTAMNQMMGDVKTYIHDLYVLEIKRKDAHMNALQAQINPHFMSNTLEYIRMYALSQGQVELSEVVYAFSALLRNNVTIENTTTLEKEIDFCEKYVYLYQMRFPDQFAYKFEIEEQLKQVEIPKFIIQPIIENYFIYGIDYERVENALSVRAYTKKNKIKIDIRDNGKGVCLQKLDQLRESLKQTQTNETTSIGLVNVNERLYHYFGGKYVMTIDSRENEYFHVTIMIDREE
ncbi:sensor histidine kinase [Vagococcus zengguangii]|uniref:sensor histidine kinase n=1 Tax=Vagococcus zengguangii TaxID=2571750 RepID=UPI00143DEE09|nr:sensor histidine kinase [Vagococcus zengguangii]